MMNKINSWVGLGLALMAFVALALFGYLNLERNAPAAEGLVQAERPEQAVEVEQDSVNQPGVSNEPDGQAALGQSRQLVAGEGQGSEPLASEPEHPLLVRAYWEGHQVDWDSVELKPIGQEAQSLSSDGVLLLGFADVRGLDLDHAVVDGFTADTSWQADELHLTLRPGSQLSVVEVSTHKPIGGALIELPIKSHGAFLQLTGALVRLPHAESAVVVKVSAVGYESRSVGMLPGTGRRVTELEPGACEVHFHVTSDYKLVEIQAMGCRDFFMVFKELVESDGNGHMSHVRRLAPGKYHATLKGDSKISPNIWEWPTLDYKVFEVSEDGQAVNVYLNEKAVKGSLPGSVTISDLDLDRELVVEATSACGGYSESIALESKIDQRNGSQELSWNFDELFPAEYNVSLKSQGLRRILKSEGLTQTRTVLAGAATAPVHFQLSEEASVRIWVLNEEQQAVDAKVSISPGPELDRVASGAFEGKMSVIGTASISARAEGYQRASKSVMVQPGLNVFELQLEEGGEAELRLRILCDGTEIPVTIDVITSRLKLTSSSGELAPVLTASSSDQSRSTGDLRADSSFDVLGYHSVGVFQVELAEGEGYSSSTGTVELIAGERAELTLNVKALE